MSSVSDEDVWYVMYVNMCVQLEIECMMGVCLCICVCMGVVVCMEFMDVWCVWMCVDIVYVDIVYVWMCMDILYMDIVYVYGCSMYPAALKHELK